MAKCDIIPNIQRETGTVESQLFPDILDKLPGGREHAKKVFSEIFDENFMDWYGDWSKDHNGLQYDSGEPLLVSPQTNSPVELMIDSAGVGVKPYGRGMYFGPARGDGLQAGFVRMNNPVRPEDVTASGVSTRLNELFRETSEDIPARLERIENSDLATATRLLEDVIRDLEYTNNNTIWSNKSDIRNVWELFGYDGIVDGDAYVIFNPYDYWTGWDNVVLNQLFSDPVYKDTPEGPSRAERALNMLRKKFGAKVIYSRDVPEGTIARVRNQGGQPVIEVHPERMESDTLFHEYAHIFIDGIGGLDNPQVRRGIELLEGTDLWNEVAGRYPDASRSTLAKEVLAEAMGREMDQMMIADQNLLTQVKNWLQLLFDRIRRVFGMNTDAVQSLSRQVLSNQLNPNFSTDRLPADYQEKRAQARERQRELDRKNKVYEQTLQNMDYRIQELRQRDDRAGIRQLERTKHELRKDLDKKLTYSGMIYFINQAVEDLDSLYTEMYNAIQEGTISADQLLQIYTSAQAYNTIPDIEYIVMADPEMSKELGPEYVQQLDFAQQTFTKINRFFQEESIDLAVNFLKPYARRKRREIELRYEKEWKDRNPKSRYEGREDQYQLDMKKYVTGRMEAERIEIDAEIEDNLRVQLQEAQQDVGSIEMWVTAMKNVNHEILQIAAEAIDQAEFTVIREGVRLKQEIEKRMKGLREYKGNPADPAKLFEDILERDNEGQLTRHVVSEYSSEFQRLERQFLRDTERVRENDSTQWHIEREAFYSKYGKANPEYLKWEQELEDARKRLDKTQFEEWKIENRPPREYIPSDRFKNKQYNKLNPEHKDYLGDDHAVVQFYRFYLDQQKKMDDMIPIQSKRLGYKLPSIRKTTVERVMAGDYQGLVENMRDQFRWTVDDIREGEIIEDFDEQGNRVYVRKDAKGNRLQYIPIHYRADIDSADQSYDVATTLLMNAHMSMNYREKNKILADLQLVQEQLRARRVGQSRGGKQMYLEAAKGRKHTIPGEQSKSYQMMDEFMSFRMFDRHTTERDPFFDYSKQIGTFMSYTGMLLLGGNVLAGVANVALGKALFFAEGVAGQYIDLGNWKTAKQYYLRNMANMGIVGDIGRERYESVVNLLMEKYDSLNTYDPISHKFADKNRFQRLIKQHQIYFMNNTGEHMMHNVTLFALLDRVKITNKQGKWIDADGKVTASRKEAATMLDMYRAEDGELKFDAENRQAEWDGKFYQFGDDLDFRITQRVRQLNEYMHGAYADQNSNYLQRFTTGRLAIMMRKWIEPGVRRRLAGFKGAWYGEQGMRWDQQLNDFHEGTVTTLYRFMRDSWNEGEGLKFSLAANWNKMNDIERANMHRLIVESAIMTATLVFAHAMYGIARDMSDDDEANRYWYLGYQANRLFSELAFYYPPFSINEMYRVLKSPAASISLIERTMRLSGQIWDPLDEYKAGRRKGELKIGKYARDMVPFYNPIERVQNMADLVNIVYN